jgi:hypothetical protein
LHQVGSSQRGKQQKDESDHRFTPRKRHAAEKYIQQWVRLPGSVPATYLSEFLASSRRSVRISCSKLFLSTMPL